MAIQQLESQVGLERSPNIATVINITYLLAPLLSPLSRGGCPWPVEIEEPAEIRVSVVTQAIALLLMIGNIVNPGSR
jgi:hypothetical protein